METDFEERAALIEYGAGVPREWAEGYARLLCLPFPTEITPERWKQIIDDGGYFIDRWAVMDAQLGWTTREVFGISPARRSTGLIGLDWCQAYAGSGLFCSRQKRPPSMRAGKPAFASFAT